MVLLVLLQKVKAADRGERKAGFVDSLDSSPKARETQKSKKEQASCR